MAIPEIHQNQVAFFKSNKTKDISFRIKQLKKIKQVLKENEAHLFQAIEADFGKSSFETYATEFSLTYHEINQFIKKIGNWSARKRVWTGLANFPAKSYILAEPLGTVFVIGAWNYPYQLSLLPAITAIAAGNTVILKPSELPARTSSILAEIINKNFPPEFFCVVEGGVAETTELLDQKFDKIFFTGSTAVGKIIYQAAAKHLTPVTLELGGKSPTFILPDADLKMAAKRIIWAKFLNAGQTCIAPDYIIAHESIRQDLLTEFTKELKSQYAVTSTKEEHYVQIINDANFNRLQQLIDPEKLFYGGVQNAKERFISPTILTDIDFNHPIMEDEIFGPILPILAYSNLSETIARVKEKPKPLSCYIYGKNRKQVKQILNELSFGGGAINDSVMHITNSNLPFGGVGQSGMGSYHGKVGFDSFTHFKSIIDKPNWFEMSIKYPPYSDFKLKLIKWFMG
jgi:aldehyde dehydrogenase (NAD+)